MRRTAITKTYNTERKLFYAAVSTFALLCVGYVYFLSAGVAHVVVRKELNQEITETQTRISDLESEFIIAKNSVGAEAVAAHGFEMNEEKVFVTKVSSNVVLSLNKGR